MEPSDRHRWIHFVTFCTLDQSVDHLCHQGSNLSHCRQLLQLPSSIHTIMTVQQFLAVPRQRWGDGATLTIHSQSTATVLKRKQWPLSSAAGYLMSLAPRKTSPSSQRGQRHVPGCGNTLCEGQKRSATVDWEQFVPN